MGDRKEFAIGEALAERVVGIVEFQGRLFVALETGVYVKGDDDVFRQMVIEQAPNVGSE